MIPAMLAASLQVSHFTAATIWAFFASVVFGITQRNDPRSMLRFGAYCFCWFFVGGIFLASWIMWTIHH